MRTEYWLTDLHLSEGQLNGLPLAYADIRSNCRVLSALLLAERGAKIVLGARQSELLAALVARIVAAGGEAIYAATDVVRRADLAALVHLAQAHFGRLDVVVNNAGSASILLLDELRVDDWEAMVDVAIPPVAIACAIAFTIKQPADVDANEIVVRPTA